MLLHYLGNFLLLHLQHDRQLSLLVFQLRQQKGALVLSLVEGCRQLINQLFFLVQQLVVLILNFLREGR